MIVHTSLIAEDTRLHIVQVVLSALLECGIVAFLLELLCFEVVTRVVLVAYRKRYDVQFAKVSSHSQHLEYRLLCPVVRVLCSSFALCNPYILLLLCHRIVYILTHQLT